MRPLQLLLLLGVCAAGATASRHLLQEPSFKVGTSNDAKKCASKLLNQAVLPAETVSKIPANAPEVFAISGKFDTKNNRRNDTLGSIDKGTNVKLPIQGQPIQGFSGIKSIGNGSYYVITDNGFGNKANSPDALLMAHTVTPNWGKNEVKVDRTLFFSDPNKVIPFVIQNEVTKERYLTGADLDVESMQPVGDSIFIGDEFGPYLVEFSRYTGVAKGFWDVPFNKSTLTSPDNPLIKLPNTPLDLVKVEFNVRRSKGFEGMAQSPDGKYLYPLLEGALFDKSKNDYENVDGTYFLRIFQFDVAGKTFANDSVAKYPLAIKTNSIGDFNMINDKLALVIERDDGEGDPRLACTVANVTGCYKTPAAFKRIYVVDVSAAKSDPTGFVKKLAYIDLLDIKDPDNKGVAGSVAGVYNMPFVTIEDVDVVSPTSIIVANDNNFPGSSARAIGKSDNNEFVVLDVGKFLEGNC